MNVDKETFIRLLRQEVQKAIEEYHTLEHERQRLEMELARTRIYLDHLNNFLKDNGIEPIIVPQESE